MCRDVISCFEKSTCKIIEYKYIDVAILLRFCNPYEPDPYAYEPDPYDKWSGFCFWKNGVDFTSFFNGFLSVFINSNAVFTTFERWTNFIHGVGAGIIHRSFHN
jgi:hypothetical protein